MDSMTMQETIDFIDQRMARGEFTQHVVVNVAKIVNMRTDRQLAESVGACDLINIDGMGVVWAARALGYVVPERVAGIDLFERLLALAAVKAIPVYFLGATEEVLARTVERCQLRHPELEIAGFHHGYFNNAGESDIVEGIRDSGAKMLFVAISSPYKENFINRWKSQLGVEFVMGVGGTFDVVAGKVSRAPLWMQKRGLEWLYRVIQEPRRMLRRYLVTNGQFAMMLAAATMSRIIHR
jgi:N-acetylglucosaminyldiphosphoundecaprenol N-acetyl-beta-D-mannosaminyltransferase